MPPRSAPLPGPLPVTKNVMFGACGSCGGAAGCCCATAPPAKIRATDATKPKRVEYFILDLPSMFDRPRFAPLAPGLIQFSWEFLDRWNSSERKPIVNRPVAARPKFFVFDQCSME